jgi:broad specificity phosphatase PhoE
MSTASRKVYLVRHGVTEWNRSHRYQGQIDVPLTTDGERQAQAAGQALAGCSIVQGFASDLARAADTARIISRESGIPFEFDSAIREVSLGELEGQHRDIAHGAINRYAEDSDAPDIHARPKGGESLHDVSVRCRRFVDSVVERFAGLDDGDLCIVAHGGSLRMLMATIFELPISTSKMFHFDNCSITTIELSAGKRPLLLSHNDCHHLVRAGIAIS